VGPFVDASRRSELLSKLVTRAADQPPATTAAAIAAQASCPRSDAAKKYLEDTSRDPGAGTLGAPDLHAPPAG
jgi:hypothetical protein